MAWTTRAREGEVNGTATSGRGSPARQECPPAGLGRQRGMAVNPIQLQKFLGGIDYPTDKQTLLDTAKKNGADDNVLETLKNLSADHFNSPNDVSEAFSDS
jgi:hypothetical protein